MRSAADNPRTLWLIVGLCLPTIAAFLIVLSVTIHPNMFAYLLMPLMLIAPICLLSAIAVTFYSRHTLARQRLRFACLAILLAIASGIATLMTVARAVV